MRAAYLGAVLVADEKSVLDLDDSDHVAVVEFLLLSWHLAEVLLGVAGGRVLVIGVEVLAWELLLWGHVVLLLLGSKSVVLCGPGRPGLVAVAGLVFVALEAHLLLVVLVESLRFLLGEGGAVVGGGPAVVCLRGGCGR